MSQEDEICYIHKMAFVKHEVEEPIPFAGIVKFVEILSTYKSMMYDFEWIVFDIFGRN